MNPPKPRLARMAETKGLVILKRLRQRWIIRACAVAFALLFGMVPAIADMLAPGQIRLKDLVEFDGVRGNDLVGYGLVVGLNGTGDGLRNAPFTEDIMSNILERLGVNVTGEQYRPKNVAAVFVTAALPPFARAGSRIDVTVSAIGDAKSLLGGTLIMTPLKGADGQVYAMAQGNLLVGGVGAAAGGSKVQVNHLSVGRIPDGATVERAVATALGQGDYINLQLNVTDFTTAMRLANAINSELSPGAEIAAALDGRTIQVSAPQGSARVAFIARIENLQVDPAQAPARVTINARTGSVVMNQAVTLESCAVSHGNLTVVINTESAVSQPNPLSAGETVVTTKSTIDIQSDKGAILVLKKGVSLNEVVRALNSIGATPQDLLAILQAMKSAGALRAELEVI